MDVSPIASTEVAHAQADITLPHEVTISAAAALQAGDLGAGLIPTATPAAGEDDKPDAGLAALLSHVSSSVVALALKNLQAAHMLHAQQHISSPTGQLLPSLPPPASLTLPPSTQPLPTTLPPIPMLSSLPTKRTNTGMLRTQTMEGALNTAASLLGANSPIFPHHSSATESAHPPPDHTHATTTIAAALPLDISMRSEYTPVPDLNTNHQPTSTNSGPSWTEAQPDFSRDFSTALPPEDEPATTITTITTATSSEPPPGLSSMLKPMTSLLWGNSLPPTPPPPTTHPADANIDDLGYPAGGPGSLTYPQKRYLDGYKAVSFVRTGELKQLFGPDARTRLPVHSALRLEIDGVLQPDVHSQVIFKETGANNSVYYIKGFKAALALGKMHCGFRRFDSQTCVLLLRTIRPDDPAMAHFLTTIPRGRGAGAGRAAKRELAGHGNDIGPVKRGRRNVQKPRESDGDMAGGEDVPSFVGSDVDEEDDIGANGGQDNSHAWHHQQLQNPPQQTNVAASQLRSSQSARSASAPSAGGGGLGQCLGALADVAAAAFEAEHNHSNNNNNNKRVAPPAVPNPWLPSNRQQRSRTSPASGARSAGTGSYPPVPALPPALPPAAPGAKPSGGGPPTPGQKPPALSPAFSMATQIHAGLSNWAAPLPVLLLEGPKSGDGTFTPSDIRCALAGVLQALRRLDVPPHVTLAVFQSFSQLQGTPLANFLTRGYTLLCHAHSAKDPSLIVAALGLSLGQSVHDLLKTHITSSSNKLPHTPDSTGPTDTQPAPMHVGSPADAAPDHHGPPDHHHHLHHHVEISQQPGGLSPHQGGTSESGEEGGMTLSGMEPTPTVSHQHMEGQEHCDGSQALADHQHHPGSTSQLDASQHAAGVLQPAAAALRWTEQLLGQT